MDQTTVQTVIMSLTLILQGATVWQTRKGKPKDSEETPSTEE